MYEWSYIPLHGRNAVVTRSMTIDVIKPDAAKHSRADMMQCAEYDNLAFHALEILRTPIQAQQR